MLSTKCCCQHQEKGQCQTWHTVGLQCQWAVVLRENRGTLETSFVQEDPRAHPSCEAALGPG